MPKARATPTGCDSWQNCPPPQTPLQQCAFLDLCTKWLVQEPALNHKPSDRLEERTLWTRAHPAHCVSRMAHTHSELRTQVAQTCAFCKEMSGVRPVVANAFAQRCFILLCERCRAQ